MNTVSDVANSPLMWIMAIALVGVVVVQATLYLRLAIGFSDQFAILTSEEKKTVYKTAAVNSVGPAVAVFFVALSLIAVVGAPMTLMRIGVIGSAYFELFAAHQGAIASGVEINTPSYNLSAFTASVWAMSLGGCGWLVSALFLTKRLGDAQSKLKKARPKTLLVMGAITPVAIFLVLSVNTVIAKTSFTDITVEWDKFFATLAAALCMIFVRVLGKKIPQIKEWALGLAFITGLAAGYIAAYSIV